MKLCNTKLTVSSHEKDPRAAGLICVKYGGAALCESRRDWPRINLLRITKIFFGGTIYRSSANAQERVFPAERYFGETVART